MEDSDTTWSDILEEPYSDLEWLIEEMEKRKEWMSYIASNVDAK